MKYDNTTVRRQDRLLQEENAVRLLKNGEYGYLSLIRDNGKPYGIPISYVWDGKSTIYLHCAPTGTKLQCMAHVPEVSFCVVGRTNIIPRQFTTEYESILLTCHASTNLNENEKMEALKLLIGKYAPDDVNAGLKAAAKSLHRTEIIRLDVQQWSGKAKVKRQ